MKFFHFLCIVSTLFVFFLILFYFSIDSVEQSDFKTNKQTTSSNLYSDFDDDLKCIKNLNLSNVLNW